jgi:hypothetical protein
MRKQAFPDWVQVCAHYQRHRAEGGRHGAGGHGKGFPSCFSCSSGNAKLLDSNNAPNINILTNSFFILKRLLGE